MPDEEVQLRARYLGAACVQAAQGWAERLLERLPAQAGRADPQMRRIVLRELGLLARHWSTRQIWHRLETNEHAAKELNLAVLRVFTETFKLPRDGSGLRYASLGSLSEEARELSARLVTALGLEHPPLVRELQAGIIAWREAVLRAVEQSLTLSREQVAATANAQRS